MINIKGKSLLAVFIADKSGGLRKYEKGTGKGKGTG